MIEHTGPTRFDVTAMQLDVRELRQLDAFECALFAQYRDELLLLRTRVGVAVKIDDIVEIAWPGTLGKRPKLFSEGPIARTITFFGT